MKIDLSENDRKALLELLDKASTDSRFDHLNDTLDDLHVRLTDRRTSKTRHFSQFHMDL